MSNILVYVGLLLVFLCVIQPSYSLSKTDKNGVFRRVKKQAQLYSNSPVKSQFHRDKIIDPIGDLNVLSHPIRTKRELLSSSSAVFLVDVISPPSDGWNSITDAIAKIVNSLPKLNEYMFVTFAHSYNGYVGIFRSISSNRDSFLEYVKENVNDNSFEFRGEGCLEGTLLGVYKLLKETNDGASFFVFTDSTGSSEYIDSEVMNTLNQKEFQITFIITGFCDEETRTDFGIYAVIGKVYVLAGNGPKQIIDDLLENRLATTKPPTNTITVKSRDLSTIYVRDGTSFTIQCQTESFKSSTFVMTHHGKILKDLGSIFSQYGVFEVESAKLYDSGKYECNTTTENVITQRIVSVYLEKPNYKYLQYSAMNNETNVEMSCIKQPNHVGTGTGVWYFNDTKIDIDGIHFKISGHNLIISRVNRAHKGFYTCYLGKMKTVIFFEVLYAPKLPPQLDDQVIGVKYGDSIDINCTADATPRATVKWIQPFAKNLSELDSPLHISSFESVNEGEYICILDNGVEPNAESRFRVRGIAIDAPKLVKPNTKYVNILEGEDITLTCMCKMCEPLNILSWSYVDDQQYDHRNFSTEIHSQKWMNQVHTAVTLKNVTTQNTGTYTCKAQNQYGSDEFSIEINVKKPPSFEDLKKDSLVRECVNKNSILTVISTTEHIPDKEYTAYDCSSFDNTLANISIAVFDAKRIKPNSKIVNEVSEEISNEFCELNELRSTDLALILNNKRPNSLINSWKRSKSGVFECKFPGDSYSDVKKNRLLVIFAEMNIQLPNDKQIIQINKPKPREPMLMCSSPSKQPENHEQAYDCDAFHNILSTKKTFYFIVNEPPKILSEFGENFILTNGTSETIECSAVGSEPMNIYWKHGDTLIPHKQLQLHSNGQEKMTYICVAENEFGSDSRILSVVIKDRSKLEIGASKYGATTTILMGKNRDLICPFWNYDEFEWFIDGEIVPHIATQMITLQNVSRNHEGNYMCRARYKAKQHEYTYKVNVYSPPTFKNVSLNGTTFERISGENFSTDCVANGYPTPKIEWIHGGKVISTGQTLHINNINASHEGDYICIARIEDKETSMKFYLDVLTKPNLRIKTNETFRTKHFWQGDHLLLVCPFDDFDEFDWFIDGQLYPNATAPLLRFPNVSRHDAGNYTCQVRNKFGKAEFTYKINVYAPPIIEESSLNETTVEALEGKNFTTDCVADGNPFPKIEWIQGGRVISTGQTLHINNINASHEGEYICIARVGDKETSKKFYLSVFTKPKRLIGTESNFQIKLVRAGEDQELVCPFLDWDQVEWFINGELAFGITTQIVTIKNISQNYEGNFTCRVGNMAGDIEYTYKIIAYSAPTIEDLSRNGTTVKVISGKNFSTDCVAKGHPSPNIEWTDGAKVISTNATLFIENVDEYDQGEYICNAKNEEGVASMRFNLTVSSKPKLIGTIEGVETKVFRLGDEPTLICPFKNFNEFMWYINGTRAYHLITQIITFPNISRLDEGNYTCRVLNEIGNNEHTYVVIVSSSPIIENVSPEETTNKERVYSPPIIEDHSALNGKTTNVVLGANFSEDCIVNGHTPTKIEWTQSGKVISTNATLFIESVDESDQGEYVCTAENEYGTTSLTFNLNVVSEPKHINDATAKFESKRVRLGEKLTLNCPFKDVERFEWFKNEKALNLAEETNVIPKVDLSSEGNYMCRAQNKAGNNEHIFKVNVFLLPIIDDLSLDGSTQKAISGAKFSADCIVRGHPSPTIKWTQDNNVISTNATLFIENVDESDQGEYVCTAKNEEGEASLKFNLIVLSEPKLTKDATDKFETKVVLMGDNVTLKCPFKEYDDLEWFRDGVSLKKKTIDIDFPNISPADEGKITCRVKNDAGESEYTFDVVVHWKPSIGNSYVNGTTENVTLGQNFSRSCEANAYPLPKIEWIHNGKVITTNETLSIDNFKTTDQGEYNCTAKNEYGATSIKFNLNISSK